MPIWIIALMFSAAIGGGAAAGGGGGGGGGGSSSGGNNNRQTDPQWTVTSTQANVYRTTEYNNQWGLEGIHAAEAYAVLDKNSKTNGGDGVKIGVVDSGVQTDHVEIAGNYSATGSYDYVNTDSNPLDDRGHGTHVASTSSGVKDGSGIHGVAFDSTIIAEKSLGSNGSGTYAQVSDGIDGAVTAGVDVINLSLGGYSTDTGLRNSLINAKDNDVFIAAATANDSLSQPAYPARYASDASLAGYMIAVAAVDDTSTIADFSNYCGDAKNYCLAAPGVDIYGATSDTNAFSATGPNAYVTLNGTSMATPHVAGAAAVLRAAWPSLTAPQVTDILLNSATDLGTIGVDSVYGHGMLNLYAAVQAKGQNLLGSSDYIGGNNSGGGGYDMRDTSFSSSSIFGDSFTNNIAPQLNAAIFYDDYGRDYKAFLGDKISNAPIQNSAFNVNNILLNNFRTKTVPMAFGAQKQNQFKFSFADYQNGGSATNPYGLRHAVIDNSKDPQTGLGRGFSFTRDAANFSPNLKFGFAINIDEVATSDQNSFGNFGFISQNNFAANPYQSFFQNSQIGSSAIVQNSNSVQRNFTQFFAQKDFMDKKFGVKFSYQTSYDSTQILNNISQKQNQLSDLTLAFRPKFFGNFLLSFGNLTEFNNNMLNAKSLGAFESAGNVKTSYVKFSTSQAIAKNLFLLTSISEGVSTIPGNQRGVFRGFNDVRSRSSSVALIRENIFNGKIGMVYSEPMRVYRGSVNIDIPTAIDANGNISRYQTTASLTPKGKEQDLEFFYSRDVASDAQLKFNLIAQKNAGNNANAPMNYLGMTSFSSRF